jgi:hypothetical protein
MKIKVVKLWQKIYSIRDHPSESRKQITRNNDNRNRMRLTQSLKETWDGYSESIKILHHF